MKDKSYGGKSGGGKPDGGMMVVETKSTTEGYCIIAIGGVICMGLLVHDTFSLGVSSGADKAHSYQVSTA